MALFDVVAPMSRNPEAVGQSIYNDACNWVDEEGVDRQPAWDPAVPQDMRHPLFSEHKRRFELWQDAQDDDDW